MPKVDTYGTQQPVALLKLLIDKGFLYDRGKDLTIKYIKDLQFIGAMVPGRNPVDPRFMRLSNTFAIAFLPKSRSRGSLDDLAHFLLDGRLRHQQGDDFSHKAGVAMEIHLIVAALPPTPAKFHYIFNLRDLSRVVEACSASPPTSRTRRSPSCGCSATNSSASLAIASSTTPTATL